MTASSPPQPLDSCRLGELHADQCFHLDADRLVRRLTLGSRVIESSVRVYPGDERAARSDPLGMWWTAYLEGRLPSTDQVTDRLGVVDLFCGSGGLALGTRLLAAEMGLSLVNELIVDSDADATATLAANHDVRIRRTESVTSLVDFRVRGSGDDAEFTYQPELLDEQVVAGADRADLLTAGPPCQGHSNLNNRSRRSDMRNHLMLTVPAFAVAAGIRCVVIENVPAVVHDDASVIATTKALLASAGYRVTDGVLASDKMGWPQTRKRYFMVACHNAEPVPLDAVASCLADEKPRTLEWALSHLDSWAADETDPMDQPTEHNQENQRRIDWLFENNEYDLALSERPECHKDGTSYTSVYGRMRPDEPAPTITTGFTTPGRGRFVHPNNRRTLTPREAAVIQGFPLDYRFITESGSSPSRTQLSKWIGDAVPMPLGYAAALSALAATPV